jgi:glucan 1,3-beta-glucosidase
MDHLVRDDTQGLHGFTSNRSHHSVVSAFFLLFQLFVFVCVFILTTLYFRLWGRNRFQFHPIQTKKEGCVDGALDYVDTLLDWAYSNGLTVLLDIHALKDSQNGFDNSGQAMGFRWTSAINSDFSDIETFEHWPIRSARWMGEFDQETASYPDINRDNIQHALDVIQLIVERYSGHPAVLGLEPVNEPWQFTPIDELKKFYWDGYLIVKKGAPYWKYIMHDSFRLDPNIWGGFMDG